MPSGSHTRERWKARANPRQPNPEPEAALHIHRIDNHERRKPMTLEEALLEMDRTRDYMVYRDAVTNRVSVLIRRGEGHFDLVEG